MRPRNKILTNRDKGVLATLRVEYGEIGFDTSTIRETPDGYEFTVYTTKQKKEKPKREDRPRRVDRDG